MGLTITDSSSIISLISNYNRINAERSVTLARLATAKRINKASDDPAGLIAVNSLSAELASVDAAINNNTRSQAILDTASGTLAELSSLANDIQTLAVASAGNTLSADELAANQSQIDSALDSMDRIINSASFGGKSLFGGANKIDVSMTAADAADLKDVRIYTRHANENAVALTVNVASAATRATTSGTVVADISGTVNGDTTLSISGKDGTASVILASGSNLASVVATINAAKADTGVSATASGTQLKLTSVEYGADSFVSVSALSGDATILATANFNRTNGTDAAITVNGQSVLVNGTEFFYSGGGVSLSATLVDNTTGTRTITVDGTGGATFQIGTNLASKEIVGLSDMNTWSLGRSGLGYLSDLRSGGSASLANDPAQAAMIARKAALQVSTAAGRIGGFCKYQIEASTNSLSVAKENLAAAISSIQDADMAAETSRLDRLNLLSNATISLLGLVSSQQQSVLSLLSGLRG